MTGGQLTALFLLLLALLVSLLFGFWTGLAGAFVGLREVARGAPALFGIGLLLLALGSWAGLRQAILAGLLGLALAVAGAAALGLAPGDPAPTLVEAGWLLVLVALAWRDAAARWILPVLVLAVATTRSGAYAAGLLLSGAHPSDGRDVLLQSAGGLAAGGIVMLAAGVMLEMLALLLSGIARPPRIVAALAGAAALVRLAREL